MSRANPNSVWSPKSLVRGNLDKMRGKILGYNKASRKEIEEILKIIKKSDYNVVE